VKKYLIISSVCVLALGKISTRLKPRSKPAETPTTRSIIFPD
jgi:hypothetical protein